jgi:hypothetical protein
LYFLEVSDNLSCGIKSLADFSIVEHLIPFDAFLINFRKIIVIEDFEILISLVTQLL